MVHTLDPNSVCKSSTFWSFVRSHPNNLEAEVVQERSKPSVPANADVEANAVELDCCWVTSTEAALDAVVAVVVAVAVA